MLVKLSKVQEVQWRTFWPALYIEPLAFALVFARSFSSTVMRNEIIYQACTVVFGYNVSECKQLGTSNLSEHAKAIETEVQPYAVNLFMIRTVLESIVPAFCGVFVGSWSDHYGRKPLLAFSLIGFSLTYIIMVVVCQLSYYYVLNPWWYILAVLPQSLLGGRCVFSVALFCCVSDVTDTNTRPCRMISLEASFFIGLMMGSLLSSYVYTATNATVIFSISTIALCMATVSVFFIEESLGPKMNDATLATKRSSIDLAADVTEQCEEKLVEVLSNLKNTKESEDHVQDKAADGKVATVESGTAKMEATGGEVIAETPKATGLFRYVHITDMLHTFFRKRPYYDRGIIWLVTGVLFLSIFVIEGMTTVFYLFVREKFQWTIRDYAYYETVSHTTPMLGAILVFLLMRKVFRMSVITTALLSCFSEMLSNIVKAVASEPWHLYLSAGLGAFKSISGPMCRTIVSNIVPASDLGKIYSIKNILQSIAPFFAAPLYTIIYKVSLTTYPGLFNIVSAGLYWLASVFMLMVLRFKCLHKEHYGSILK